MNLTERQGIPSQPVRDFLSFWIEARGENLVRKALTFILRALKEMRPGVSIVPGTMTEGWLFNFLEAIWFRHLEQM